MATRVLLPRKHWIQTDIARILHDIYTRTWQIPKTQDMIMGA